MKYESFLELAKKRRSIRSFKPDPIPDEYVDKIIEAARWAPSGFNTQPWEFVVIKKKELKESIEAEAQRTLNEKINEEKEKIRKSEEEKVEMKFREYEKQIEDQKKLMNEMQRKYEQGSMQMQGEVQELAIEEWLQDNFPLDTITEIKKGARGADCIQTVNTRIRQNCGTIYYESKRTKDFQKRIPTYNIKNIVDTTGAGDAFNGAFSQAYWIKGWDLEKSCRYANAAASLKIQKLGARTGMPNEKQLIQFLEEHEE